MTKYSPHVASASTSTKRTRIQQENNDRIIAAALKVFSRFGYRGTTVDQIAAETGMSKANLLYYFKRKEDIYLAVLESTLTAWLAPLDTLDPKGNPAEQLWQYALNKLELSFQMPEASRVFASEIIQGAPMIEPFLQGELKDRVEQRCAVIQHWIDSGQLVRIEPIHLLFMLWACTQHYADFRTQIDALSDADESELLAGAKRTLKAMIDGLTHNLPTH